MIVACMIHLFVDVDDKFAGGLAVAEIFAKVFVHTCPSHVVVSIR